MPSLLFLFENPNVSLLKSNMSHKGPYTFQLLNLGSSMRERNCYQVQDYNNICSRPWQTLPQYFFSSHFLAPSILVTVKYYSMLYKMLSSVFEAFNCKLIS